MNEKEENEIMHLYSSGSSMYAIAKSYEINPAKVMKILQKNHIELRHDVKRKNTNALQFKVDALLETLKAEGKQLNKQDFAKALGSKRFIDAYTERYPEIIPYINFSTAKNIQHYEKKLYTWLLNHQIPFVPHSKSILNITATAILKGEYDNIILQLDIKPNNTIRLSKHLNKIKNITDVATKMDKRLILLQEKDFDDLSVLNDILKIQKGEN